MFTLLPTTLTLNTASTLDISGTSTQSFGSDQIIAVKVTNESPYALQVIGPGSAQQTWLAPWTEDVYFPGDSPTTHMQLLPQRVPGGIVLPATAQSSAVLVAVYVQGDSLPHGQWPMALSRQINIGNQLNTSSQINASAVPILLGTTATSTITVPAVAGYQLYLASCLFTCAPLSAGTGAYEIDLTSKLNGVQTSKGILVFAASTASTTAVALPLPAPVPLGTGTGQSLDVICSFVPPNSQVYTFNAIVFYI